MHGFCKDFERLHAEGVHSKVQEQNERLTVEITALRAELLECKQGLDREKQERQRLAHELENVQDFLDGFGGRPGALNELVDPEDLQGVAMQMVMRDFVDFVCVVQPPNEIVKVVRVDDVRHTHDSISRKFKNGESFADLINNLNHGLLEFGPHI